MRTAGLHELLLFLCVGAIRDHEAVKATGAEIADQAAGLPDCAFAVHVAVPDDASELPPVFFGEDACLAKRSGENHLELVLAEDLYECFIEIFLSVVVINDQKN